MTIEPFEAVQTVHAVPEVFFSWSGFHCAENAIGQVAQAVAEALAVNTTVTRLILSGAC